MGDWLREARQSIKLLVATPVFTTVAVVSLALGIGINTAVLAVARATLFAPLPVDVPHELAVAYWHSPHDTRGVMQLNSSGLKDEKTGKNLRSNFTYPQFVDLRAAVGDSADVFAFTFLRHANVSVEGQSLVGGGMLVSGNYFAALRVPMAIGRGLSEHDDREDGPPAAVLGYSLWQRAFGGDPSAVGRTIKVNGRLFTLVGVTAPRYFGVSNGGFFPPADVTIPLRAQSRVSPQWNTQWGSLFTTEEIWWLRVMLRGKPDADHRQIQEALHVRFLQHVAGANPGVQAPEVVLVPGVRGLDSLRSVVQKPLYILGGVAGLVFLIACVNVAGLVLSRGMARQREFWIRLALGAGRARLARQTFTESVLIAGAGGVLGITLAAWRGRALTTMLIGTQRNAIDVSIDVPLIVIASVVSCGAALLFGMLPALRSARAAAAPALLRLGGALGDAPRQRAGRALIALQIAVSLPLVVGSVLFLRTAHNLARVDLGFEPRNLIIFKLDPNLNGYDDGKSRQLFERVLGRLEEVPGARGATLVENALISGLVSNTPMAVDGAEPKSILVNRVGPGFFETMGLALAGGRGLGWHDRNGSVRAAVVNEAAVREFFGGQNPIGRHVRMSGFLKSEPIEIVGVARDSKYAGLKGHNRPIIFLPYLQSVNMRTMFVAVRTDLTPGMPDRIRAAVADVDRDVPVTDLKTQTAQINESIRTERMFTTLLVFFGVFAVLLACIGLYGVTSYAVERRTSEIGIRIALGAQRSHVLWLVLRQVVIVTVVGLALGVPAAAAASRSVRALLFGVAPMDPASIAIGAAAMFVIAVTAGLVPARRAAKLDPLVALRRD